MIKAVVGTNYVRKMLNDAESAGLRITVHGGGREPDYVGYHPASAEEAVIAVDEAEVEFHDTSGAKVGWALIINGLEEDERIADAGSDDWVDEWCGANISY